MEKTILITGASSGIGLAAAQRFAQLGWRVYAGVRKADDAENLSKLGYANLKPIFLDVTNPEHIDAARDRLTQDLPALHVLVNNAGIAFPAPLEYAGDVMRHMAVNVDGAVQLTQAMLPLLRKATPDARIIMMGSIGGRSSVPFFGAYCASKFSLEAISDAWRVELRPQNIHLSILEPGAIDTPIWGKSTDGKDQLFADYPPEAWELYGGSMRFLNKIIPRMGGISPEQVVDRLVHAATAKRPKARYIIGRDAWQRWLIEKLPTRWRDALFQRVMMRPK